MTSRVAALFVRSDSVYKTIPGVDCFDLARDARTFSGGLPVVAHPPCRLFSRLRTFSTAPESERELVYLAVDQVRQCGGVLEHPWCSTLWALRGLPAPGVVDSVGGWTLPVYQSAWGHRCRKATWLYIVGLSPCDLPLMPLALGYPALRDLSGMNSKAEREATPYRFALWLVDLAARCVPPWLASARRR